MEGEGQGKPPLPPAAAPQGAVGSGDKQPQPDDGHPLPFDMRGPCARCRLSKVRDPAGGATGVHWARRRARL